MLMTFLSHPYFTSPDTFVCCRIGAKLIVWGKT
jgi:hypothetical protein